MALNNKLRESISERKEILKGQAWALEQCFGEHWFRGSMGRYMPEGALWRIDMSWFGIWKQNVYIVEHLELKK